jgi:hypothetical protein
MTVYVPNITEVDLKKIIIAIQQLAAGRSNAVGTVTLTPSVATTTVNLTIPTTLPGSPLKAGTVMAVSVTPSGITLPASQVVLTPLTVNAAAEVGNGTMYVSAVGIDTFTITHANSATTGRTFAYAILG